MSCDNCKHLQRYKDTVEYWGAMVSMPFTECAEDMDEFDEDGENCPGYEQQIDYRHGD